MTLASDVSEREVLAEIDGSAGCSVKDSFADLDVSSHQFHVLFDAQWIHRAVRGTRSLPRLDWQVVRAVPQLSSFSLHAYGRTSALPPGLLTANGVQLLTAHQDDRVVGGVAFNRSSSVVGLSDLFAVGVDPVVVWRDAVLVAEQWFPGRPLVGYERDLDLEHATAAGFATIAPLRVWMR